MTEYPLFLPPFITFSHLFYFHVFPLLFSTTIPYCLFFSFLHTHTHTYIYIYIYREREREGEREERGGIQSHYKEIVLKKNKSKDIFKDFSSSSCRPHQHRYPRPFLAPPLYRPSLPAGSQGYIPYRYRVAVYRFELVVLPLLVHVKGSTGVHHSWVRPCFPSSVPHVWFV